MDKATIVTDGDITDSKSPNLWRLATVHRVEELKSIIRILPIWASGILLVASSSHQNSFTIQQASTMDRHLSGSFQIPPATLSVFGVITTLSGLVLYERLFVPFARRFTRNPSGITCLQRVGVGLMVNILGTIVASFVEIKRKAVAANHNLLDDSKAIIPMCFLVGTSVLPQWGSRSFHICWAHGISLRSITRKHEKHCRGSLLDSNINWKLCRHTDSVTSS